MKTTALASDLRMVTSKLYKRLRHQMRAVDNLSVTEVTIMSNLYFSGSLYPSEMAAIVNVKAQSMSQIINKLDEMKVINKTRSANDKRKVAISLSDKGKQMVEETRHERDKWLSNAIESNLNEAEQQILQEAVLLMEKLSEYK